MKQNKKKVGRVIRFDKYHEKINRGIALLNVLYGKNRWVNKLNIEELDLASRTQCVAGQIFVDNYGAIIKALEALDVDLSPSNFGFNVSTSTPSYDTLQMLWSRKIKAIKRRT